MPNNNYSNNIFNSRNHNNKEINTLVKEEINNEQNQRMTKKFPTTTNVDILKQFLKLKRLTFNSGMNSIKANEWLA